MLHLTLLDIPFRNTELLSFVTVRLETEVNLTHSAARLSNITNFSKSARRSSRGSETCRTFDTSCGPVHSKHLDMLPLPDQSSLSIIAAGVVTLSSFSTAHPFPSFLPLVNSTNVQIHWQQSSWTRESLTCWNRNTIIAFCAGCSKSYTNSSVNQSSRNSGSWVFQSSHEFGGVQRPFFALFLSMPWGPFDRTRVESGTFPTYMCVHTHRLSAR